MIDLAETDYCYGTGPLRLRVTHVPPELTVRGLEWVELAGVELDQDGTDLLLVGHHRTRRITASGENLSVHSGQQMVKARRLQLLATFNI